MASIVPVFLFEKKDIIFKGKEYEIFELIDYAAAIEFINKNEVTRFNILTGNNQGITCNKVNNFKKNEGKYVCLSQSLKQGIEQNEDIVNFNQIREKQISQYVRYFTRAINEQTRLTSINDEELIEFLDSQKAKEQAPFVESFFDKETDISNMYLQIKKTIISQDEQIMQILTALFKNQTVVNSDLDLDLIAKLKENVLISGPTGTGKTEILKRISRLYNIPIVIEDSTLLSETGYVGRKVTDMLEDLLLAANSDIKLAQKGILVIDEFDKLAEKSGSSHVSRIGVQRSLLKLLDGSKIYASGREFDTSKLTVVGLGAFSGITSDSYKNLTTEDFEKYGIMPELIGRFSKIVKMNSLTKEDLMKILVNSDFSPLNTYRQLFELLKVDFEYTDEFVEWLAGKAEKLNTGARSLKTIFDECISGAMFRIFAGEYKKISLIKPEQEEKTPYVLVRK